MFGDDHSSRHDSHKGSAELSREIVGQRKIRQRLGPGVGDDKGIGHVNVARRAAGSDGGQGSRLGYLQITNPDRRRIVGIVVRIRIQVGGIRSDHPKGR